MNVTTKGSVLMIIKTRHASINALTACAQIVNPIATAKSAATTAVAANALPDVRVMTLATMESANVIRIAPAKSAATTVVAAVAALAMLRRMTNAKTRIH